MEGDFLYENRIEGYIDGDAVVKSESFVRNGVINKQLYQNGLFIWFGSDFHYRKMSYKNPYIHFDTSSVFKIFGSMRYKAIQEGTLWEKTEIHPACGSYYKKYSMKIEVLYLGLIMQRIPLFMNCSQIKEYMRENNGRDYEMTAIPTYLITHVFELEEF